MAQSGPMCGTLCSRQPRQDWLWEVARALHSEFVADHRLVIADDIDDWSVKLQQSKMNADAAKHPLVSVEHHPALAVVCGCCPTCEFSLQGHIFFCPWLCECIMSGSDKTRLECPVSSACVLRVLNSRMDFCAGEPSTAGTNTFQAFSEENVALWSPDLCVSTFFELCVVEYKRQSRRNRHKIAFMHPAWEVTCHV